MPAVQKYGKLYMKDASGSIIEILPRTSTSVPNYQGATSSSAGIAGLVPAAQSSQKDFYLKGDGTWGSPDMYNEDVVSLSGSAIDLSLGRTFTKIVSANTTFTITNAPAGKMTVFTLGLTNGGAYTVTWPNSVSWNGGNEPELAEEGVNILTFTTLDGGTHWYAGMTFSS